MQFTHFKGRKFILLDTIINIILFIIVNIIQNYLKYNEICLEQAAISRKFKYPSVGNPEKTVTFKHVHVLKPLGRSSFAVIESV